MLCWALIICPAVHRATQLPKMASQELSAVGFNRKLAGSGPFAYPLITFSAVTIFLVALHTLKTTFVPQWESRTASVGVVQSRHTAQRRVACQSSRQACLFLPLEPWAADGTKVGL